VLLGSARAFERSHLGGA